MTEKNLNLIRELEEQIEDIKIKLKESNCEDEKEKLADNYQKVYTELNEVYMENEKIMNRLERENGL
ncbi:hypothetical protein [uncultured Fusobacterium sp.]|uniref:hypothetical protein n=1 Tax=uncultured Fusobacterium sp. TaxID=159267 RepID=UPI000BBB2E59|nr:hypothetical protein [uncultured Fusobacterium sp.]BBA50879.1 hypothetical protein FV113G1_12280 [Fusobacterium varium]